jgi:hypothetical protein
MTTEEYDILTRPYLERMARQTQLRNEREWSYAILAALFLCIFAAACCLTLSFLLNY